MWKSQIENSPLSENSQNYLTQATTKNVVSKQLLPAYAIHIRHRKVTVSFTFFQVSSKLLSYFQERSGRAILSHVVENSTAAERVT